MADMIVSYEGKNMNFGDPDNSDPRYTVNGPTLSSEAFAELSKYPAMVILDLRERGGPKTKAYLDDLEAKANSRLIFGFMPKLPDRIED